MAVLTTAIDRSDGWLIISTVRSNGNLRFTHVGAEGLRVALVRNVIIVL